MKTRIYDDYAAFLARDDKRENGVSAEFAERHPDYEMADIKRCADEEAKL